MTKPDLSLLDGVVAPEVLDALRRGSEALTRARVRHVVVGGLAVGANGYPRATKDVDFLVGQEAFVHHPGGLVTLRPEVPFQVNGVAIDLLSPEADEPFLNDVLAQPPGSIMEAGPLVYMKLKASRLRDRGDVAELVKKSIDVAAVRSYLQQHAPPMAARFDDLVREAEAEE
jgi:hypothetical protein